MLPFMSHRSCLRE